MAPKFRLFCLPHAGGSTTGFRSWGRSLPPWMQVSSILLPGRETRSAHAPFTDIRPLVDTMAEELAPWLDLPYAVFGHSMGALLAFEWVRSIQRAGLPMPRWLFLSGRRSPDSQPDTEPLAQLPDKEFISELIRLYDGIPEEIRSDAEFIDFILPILRADISVVESYRFEEGEPLNCPVTVFAGVNDPSVSWAQMMAWNRQTRGRFAMKLLPGGHFYPQQPLLQAISGTISELDI